MSETIKPPDTVARIVELAQKVRDAFEEIGKSNCFPDNLCGLCLRASVQLFVVAGDYGMDIEMVGGFGHCYNMCDGWIIDVTATQFGITDRVMVVPPREIPELVRNPNWTRVGTYRTLEDVYSGMWNEACVFAKDRAVVLKHVVPLLGETIWLGKENEVSM